MTENKYFKTSTVFHKYYLLIHSNTNNSNTQISNFYHLAVGRFRDIIKSFYNVGTCNIKENIGNIYMCT